MSARCDAYCKLLEDAQALGLEYWLLGENFPPGRYSLEAKTFDNHARKLEVRIRRDANTRPG